MLYSVWESHMARPNRQGEGTCCINIFNKNGTFIIRKKRNHLLNKLIQRSFVQAIQPPSFPSLPCSPSHRDFTFLPNFPLCSIACPKLLIPSRMLRPTPAPAQVFLLSFTNLKLLTSFKAKKD
jgi:hypothetical protein